MAPTRMGVLNGTTGVITTAVLVVTGVITTLVDVCTVILLLTDLSSDDRDVVGTGAFDEAGTLAGTVVGTSMVVTLVMVNVPLLEGADELRVGYMSGGITCLEVVETRVDDDGGPEDAPGAPMKPVLEGIGSREDGMVL